MFDWIAFLRSRDIPFADSGSNVSKGNVVTHCPFCGDADAGMHLSVSLNGDGWRCFRRPREHKGIRPTRLIQGLLKCSWTQAVTIAGASSSRLPVDFMSAVNDRLAPPPDIPRAPLKLPKEFKPLTNGMPSSDAYVTYLIETRGFTWQQVRGMEAYGVMYCNLGTDRGRIMFVILDHYGKLVTWTGRTISDYNPVRYKTLSADPEKSWAEGRPPAVNPITHYLPWYAKCANSDANTLVLCEGPFDSLKVNILGRRAGIVSTCFFTMEPSDEQIDLLHSLVGKFKRRFLLLDRGTTATAMKLTDDLKALGIERRDLPTYLKDPGEVESTNQLLSILD